MENSSFDLRSSPFWLLRADYGSSAADIAALVDDAEFDGEHSVDSLHRAQQVLVTPRSRLSAELAWLPELSPIQVKKAIEIVASGGADATLEAIDHLPELAKANITAHLLQGNVNLDACIDLLCRAWQDVEAGSLALFINERRSEAGLPATNKGQVEEALSEVRLNHGKSAALAVWKTKSPGLRMTAIVERQLQQDAQGVFLSVLVREYDARSVSALSRIASKIEEEIETAKKADSSLEETVTSLSSLLDEWDVVNQAVQLYEQSRGHEEGRSRQIYDKLRTLCLELANKNGRYKEALRLSEALLRTFPELESVAESLRKDVDALEELSAQQELHSRVEPLVEACDAAKRDALKFRTALVNDGFNANATSVAGSVAKAFHSAKKSLEDPTIAFLVIRDLALFLNNEKNDPETAFRLLDAFLKHVGRVGPSDVLQKLIDERAVLYKNWKMRELEANSGDLDAMLRTVEELLKYATGSERVEIERLRDKINSQRSAKKRKVAFYAVIALVIGFFVVADEIDSPQRSAPTSSTAQDARPSPSVNRTEASPSPSTRSSTTSSSVPSSVPANDYREDKPLAGRDRLLTTNQVRYCVFQGERLDYMRPLANSSFQISKFNELIRDYNSRCSSYRYQSGVLGRVEREATVRASTLRADAQRIVSSWSQTSARTIPTQPPTQPPTPPISPQISTSVPKFRVYQNTDFYGDDLTQNGYRGITISECEAMCARTSHCKGYTYSHARSWCWPKSGVGQPIAVTGLTSALKVD